MPADRYFGAAAEVKQVLQARVAANALTLARHGVPRPPLYLTGQVAGQPVSIHAEGERVIVTGPEGTRQEVDLAAAPREVLPDPVCAAGMVSGPVEDGPEEEPAPGTSPLDAVWPPAGSPRPQASEETGSRQRHRREVRDEHDDGDPADGPGVASAAHAGRGRAR